MLTRCTNGHLYLSVQRIWWKLRSVLCKNNTNMKELDKTDKGILKLLEQDGTLTHKEIAHRLHKTINPIHARIRNLENTGYIKKYRAEVDHKMIGKGLIYYTQVRLKQHSKESLNAYKTEVVKVVEVMECYHLTGPFDF